ncbi:MAG: hypothetical protein HY720_04570 [Planctomycetes bacterium]|nr:hypothetical protein [Planctomycetota bacterium]
MLLLKDADLHSHLFGPEVWSTLRWLRERIQGSIHPRWTDSLAWILLDRVEAPSDLDPEPMTQALFRKVPANLAERLTEAVAVYRYIGRAGPIPLLPLAAHLLRAEMTLYLDLKGKKPYREHLAHQTRVAALAHMLLCGGIHKLLSGKTRGDLSDVLPPGFAAQRWAQTHEYHLLRLHALRRGLSVPDPGCDPVETSRLVRAAAILAGLAHDIGYVHKSLGDANEEMARTFRSLTFPATIGGGLPLDGLPVVEMYRDLFGETDPGQRFADILEFLLHHHRRVHSLVGAIWLALLPLRFHEEVASLRIDPRGTAPDPRDGTPDGQRGISDQGSFEAACHLASMMSLAHDLALRDAGDRAAIGLLEKAEGRDVLSLERYPVSTLFTLCDVLQEFGRPLEAVGDGGSQWAVPVVALGILKEGEVEQPGVLLRGDRAHAEAMARVARIPARPHLEGRARGEDACQRPRRLHVAFGTRDTRAENSTLLPAGKALLRSRGGWEEWKVGKGVRDWLQRSGLSGHVDLAGDPDRIPTLQKEVKALLSPPRGLRTGPGLQAVRNYLQPAIPRNASRPRLERHIEAMTHPRRDLEVPSARDPLPFFAPIFDLLDWKPDQDGGSRAVR